MLIAISCIFYVLIIQERRKNNKICPNETIITIEEQNQEFDSNKYGHVWLREHGSNLNYDFNPRLAQPQVCLRLSLSEIKLTFCFLIFQTFLACYSFKV